MDTYTWIASSALTPVVNKRVDTTPAVPTREGIVNAIQQFNPISLAELGRFALLNRVETKYLIREDQMAAILASVAADYRVLEIEGRRLNLDRTIYFETDDFAMYRNHHAGALNRFKVRSREYINSEDAFFEIKFKNSKRRTIKNRIPTEQFLTNIDQKADSIVHTYTPYDAAALKPVIQNSFTRIMFAGEDVHERFTIDLDLRFYTRESDADLPGIAIAEVKQDRFSLNSPFIRQMRRLGLRPNGFSKYCMGINMLYSTVKSNNFKSRRLLIEKLAKGSQDHVFAH